MSGPHLLRVTDDTNPTYHVRRFVTATLGMPIAHGEREAADDQGSVALFFHENKDERGAPSAKVFGVSNCHVLCEHTTHDYESRAPPRLPSAFVMLGSDTSSADSTKLRTVSLATELTPRFWLEGLLDWRRNRGARTRRR